jgi:succinyl-CoA:(S)-malate CoA-transferase subunit A
VLVALRHRERTGRGQLVDVGIYEAVFRVLEEIAAAYGLHGRVREREGAGSFVAVPHGHFRTQDDRWIAIACTTDKMFERLAAAMGQPHLASSGLYGDQRKRLAARDLVNQLVVEWVGALTRDAVLARCLEHEVPAGKVNSIADIFADEHFQARGNLERFHEPDIGDIVVPGVVPRLSATPGRITHLGPPLGDATDAVLGELLGLATEELERLRQHRII